MKRNDIYLAAAVAAAAFLIWMIQRYVFSSEGEQITVTQDGETIGVYFLTEENVFTFSDGEGGQNVLVVRDGEAYISEADCPDKLCMRQKAISKKGESIICLPHRLAVEVTAGSDGGIDAMAR